MDEEHTNGMMGDNLKEIGLTIRWRVREFLHGLMAESMLAIILMIKNMESAPSHGKMVVYTTVTGSMENNMDTAHTSKMARREKVYGI
jgi:hypothetical protein